MHHCHCFLPQQKEENFEMSSTTSWLRSGILPHSQTLSWIVFQSLSSVPRSKQLTRSSWQARLMGLDVQTNQHKAELQESQTAQPPHAVCFHNLLHLPQNKSGGHIDLLVNISFTWCCGKGRVKLLTLSRSPQFNDILWQDAKAHGMAM